MYATLALVLGTPAAFSKSEVESLRDLCSAQKHQIEKLSDENARLKGSKESSKSTTISDSDDKPSKSGTYTVRSGDTIERIARKTNCSVAALGKVNNLKADTVIHPGLVLKLPGSSKSESSSAESRTVEKSAAKSSDKVASSKTEKDKKSVAKNEPKPEPKAEAKPEPKPTPSKSIASNAPSDTHTISNPKPAASQPAPAPKTETVAESKPPTTGGGAKPVIRSIIIQDETSYGAFATQHGTTPDRLNDLNGLSLSTSTVLAKGSELYIPAQP